MPRSSATKVQSQPGSHHRDDSGSHSHEEKASAQQPETSVHPVEPEDAHLTGTKRSLQRRVLGLNVEGQQPADQQAPQHAENTSAGHPGQQAQPHPETPAGQHATGSFTGDTAQESSHKGR